MIEDYQWNYLLSSEAKPMYDAMRDIVLKNNCKSILDVGCGHSIISSYNENFDIVGIDIDKKSIDYCKDNYKGKYIQMDAVNDLVYETLNKTFDCIILSGILYYFKNDQFNITQTQFVDNLIKYFSPSVLIVSEPQDRKDYNSPDYSEFLNSYKPKNKIEFDLDIRMGKRVVYEILV